MGLKSLKTWWHKRGLISGKTPSQLIFRGFSFAYKRLLEVSKEPEKYAERKKEMLAYVNNVYFVKGVNNACSLIESTNPALQKK